MLKSVKKIVVIAPHPDDETLGVGGSISKLISYGIEVHVLIIGGHLPPIYNNDEYMQTNKEAKAALKILNVTSYNFLEIPATTFNFIPIHEFNKKIKAFIDNINPEMVFIPFPDRHIDHRVVFDSSVVACRPIHKKSPKILLCYETLSETHWNAPGIEANFTPDFFIDISQFIENKISALKCYESQIKDFGARSLDANKALAKFRGSQNNCEYAEGFKVVRILI